MQTDPEEIGERRQDLGARGMRTGEEIGNNGATRNGRANGNSCGRATVSCCQHQQLRSENVEGIAADARLGAPIAPLHCAREAIRSPVAIVIGAGGDPRMCPGGTRWQRARGERVGCSTSRNARAEVRGTCRGGRSRDEQRDTEDGEWGVAAGDAPGEGVE